MENNNKLQNFLNSRFFIGLGIVLAALVGAYAFYQYRIQANTLSVTGSTTKTVTSDHVKWVGSITRVTKLSTLKEGYSLMAKDLVVVKNFLKEKNISENQINISPIFMDQNWDEIKGAEKSYTLRQTIEINSDDVNGISEIAKNISPLIEKGVIYSTQYLEFTYTKLPEERVSMLDDAISDAKARASKLASYSNKKIREVKNASTGVVQVMPSGSNQISDYGMYDTSTIEKDIMLTVKATFNLK